MKICKDGRIWGQNNKEAGDHLGITTSKEKYIKKGYNPNSAIAMLGKHHSGKTKEKMSLNHADFRGENHPMFGKHPSEITRKKMRENHADVSGKNSPFYGIHKFGKENPHWKGGEVKKICLICKEEFWVRRFRINSAKFCGPQCKAIYVLRHFAKPNKVELKLNSILQNILPNEYALNVKSDIMILGGKVPDFVNVNGQKKVIELFGEYWHTVRADNYTKTEKGRIEYFKKLGWDTLIIWERELKDIGTLKQKILKFNGGKYEKISV